MMKTKNPRELGLKERPPKFIDLTRNPAEEEDNSLSLLKRRLTSLEMESSGLYNENSALKELVLHNDQKYRLLEKQVQALNTDNQDLRAMLTEIQESIRDLDSNFNSKLSELKKGEPTKRKTAIPSLSNFRKEVIKSSAIDATISRSATSPNRDLKEFDLPVNENLAQSAALRESPPKEESYLLNDSNSMISEPDVTNEVDLQAVNPYFFYPKLTEKNFRNLHLELEHTDSFVDEGISEEAKEAFLKFEPQTPRHLGQKIRKSIQDVKKDFYPQRLFENFLVIGQEREKFKEHMAKRKEAGLDKKQKVSRYRGKVLFNYAESVKLEENVTLPDIEKFLAPWQLLITEYEKSDSEEFLVELLLKKEKKYKKKYICPFQPHRTDIQLSKWHSNTELFNPQNKLYAFCIMKNDYVILEGSKKGKSKFFCVDTVYCLLTYYPVAELAFQLLTSILNLIRLRRKDQYFAFDQDAKKTDIDILRTLLPVEISHYIRNLFEYPTPVPGDLLRFSFKNDNTGETDIREHTYRSRNDAYLEIAMWKAGKTFSKFSLENLKLLVSALLLEKSVIFFSSDITELTSTLNTFLGLMFPFKFVCTIIPALPSNLMVMCSAPVPTIIGINRREEYFWRNELTEYTDNIFVFLDSKIIYIDEKNEELGNFPTLDFFTEGITEVYNQLNSKHAGLQIMRNVAMFSRNLSLEVRVTTKKKKKIESIGSHIAERKVQKKKMIEQVFKHFREGLQKNVADNLSMISNICSTLDNQAEVDQKINELIENQNVREFFYVYKATQGFTCYPFCLSFH